jgi:hypothetical protein
MGWAAAGAAEGGKLMIPWIYADIDTIIDSYSEPPKEKPTCEDCQRECQMMGLDMDACASYKPPKEE